MDIFQVLQAVMVGLILFIILFVLKQYKYL